MRNERALAPKREPAPPRPRVERRTVLIRPRGRSWPTHREQLVLTRDGTSLFTSSTGRGSAVVLCGGVGCDGFIFRYLRPALAATHQVIHWHYRGHGRSGAPSPLAGIDVATAVDDLEHVLRAYDVERAVLIGHSMGAQLVLQAALDLRPRVAAIVPMNGTAGRVLHTFLGTRAAVGLVPVMRLAARASAGRWLWERGLTSELLYRVATAVEVDARLAKREDFEPYLHGMARVDPRIVLGYLASLDEHDTTGRLGEIDVPALVITGTRDRFTPARLAERLARGLPRGELLAVPNGSHVVAIEQPELVTLRVQKFLAVNRL